MKGNIIKKILACIIVVLFIGATVTPALTVDEFEENLCLDKTILDDGNNELVELIIEIWGPVGIQDYSIFVPQEEYLDLIRLTDEFKKDLDQALTYEEVVIIYVDMIIKLYELGYFSTIIPDINDFMPADYDYESDCDYENADFIEFATAKEQEYPIMNQAMILLDMLGLSSMNSISSSESKYTLSEKDLGSGYLDYYEPYNDNSIDVCENIFCLTSGRPENICFYNGEEVFLGALYELYYILLEWAQKQGFLDDFPFDIEDLSEIPDAIMYLLDLFSVTIQIPVGHLIGFGSDSKNSANGWVHTIGLNGIRQIEGAFYGQIPIPDGLVTDINYLGSIGFTGIRINPIGFYLGAALWVKLGLEPVAGFENHESVVEPSSETSYQNTQESVNEFNQVSESNEELQQESQEETQSNPETNPSTIPDETVDETDVQNDKNKKKQKDTDITEKKGNNK